MNLLGLLQERVVTVDDLGVDLLRHRHERHLAVQLDQGQPGRAGGVHDRGRQSAEARTELHHECGDTAVGEPSDERALLGGTGAEPQAGGEEQLTALEQRRDVGDLAGVHPAHGAAEAVGAGHHLGEAAAQPRQLKGSLHGDAALGLHLALASRFASVGPDTRTVAVVLVRKVPAPGAGGFAGAARR